MKTSGDILVEGETVTTEHYKLGKLHTMPDGDNYCEQNKVEVRGR